ncbi:hypothetical protein AKJ61_03015 [candidate division MSBL1 archaeon SCGC-AAA259B11]|uniref:4Fe-4S ferredoxin-type domain-containing protein n=1 Tax=candidate division MSBL1 archaeon SCGC-AAA259B11 TaxID=1698260 RepID=A0A133U5B8_9EURY|nr:hypothetical protein AKJ61_03015 [candidate division MSBL1 archaeon SCGC-AAA259B11]
MAYKYSALSVDYKTCLGCGNCVAACPLSNPESPLFERGKRKLRLESGVVKKNKEVICWRNPEIPEDCERCTLICPTGAIETV